MIRIAQMRFCVLYTCTPWTCTVLSATPPSGFHFQGSQNMDRKQLSSYFRLLDLPLQLDSSPHPANLALIQSRHLMRIPYQSRSNPYHFNRKRFFAETCTTTRTNHPPHWIWMISFQLSLSVVDIVTRWDSIET